jgi:hypothetical protein
MKDSDHRLLTELRRALLPLHKTLLEWERKAYERLHGRRMTGGELLKVIVADPQFAWLHPVSELIVRIDETLETDAPDRTVDLDAIVAQARRLVAPDEGANPYAQRYLTALQEVPDVVIAHRDVTAVLKDIPVRETLH